MNRRYCADSFFLQVGNALHWRWLSVSIQWLSHVSLRCKVADRGPIVFIIDSKSMVSIKFPHTFIHARDLEIASLFMKDYNSFYCFRSLSNPQVFQPPFTRNENPSETLHSRNTIQILALHVWSTATLTEHVCPEWHAQNATCTVDKFLTNIWIRVGEILARKWSTQLDSASNQIFFWAQFSTSRIICVKVTRGK